MLCQFTAGFTGSANNYPDSSSCLRFVETKLCKFFIKYEKSECFQSNMLSSSTARLAHVNTIENNFSVVDNARTINILIGQNTSRGKSLG